jgi:hypothetical protein
MKKIEVPQITPIPLYGKRMILIQFRMGFKAWGKHPAHKLLPAGENGKKRQEPPNTTG